MTHLTKPTTVFIIPGLLACASCGGSRDALRRWDVCREADVGVDVDENSLVIGCWDYPASGSGAPLTLIVDCSIYAEGAAWAYTTEDALKEVADWCADEGFRLHVIDCEPEHWDDDECPPRELPDKMIACGPD